jgi:hypothetical protein
MSNTIVARAAALARVSFKATLAPYASNRSDNAVADARANLLGRHAIFLLTVAAQKRDRCFLALVVAPFRIANFWTA